MDQKILKRKTNLANPFISGLRYSYLYLEMPFKFLIHVLSYLLDSHIIFFKAEKMMAGIIHKSLLLSVFFNLLFSQGFYFGRSVIFPKEINLSNVFA